MQNRVIGLVDDEDVFHWIVKKHIEKLDVSCEFMSFYNGDEAYQYLSSSPEVVPDIMFVDLNMPVCDGWTFLKNYSDENKEQDIDIYILSSSIDPRDQQKANEFSLVKGFISKPISNQFLTDVLGKRENRSTS